MCTFFFLRYYIKKYGLQEAWEGNPDHSLLCYDSPGARPTMAGTASAARPASATRAAVRMRTPSAFATTVKTLWPE
jgi:hypothetical protein